LRKFTIRRLIAIILIFSGFSIAWKGTKEISVDQCKIMKNISKKIITNNDTIKIVNTNMNEFDGKIEKISCDNGKAFIKINLQNDGFKTLPVDEIFKINNHPIQNLILNKATDITMSGVLKIVIGSFILILVVSFRSFFWRRKKVGA